METFKKQLELKAEEIVDTLETLDMNDKVPDIMQRRRGQDNFDQRNVSFALTLKKVFIPYKNQPLNPIWQGNEKK